MFSVFVIVPLAAFVFYVGLLATVLGAGAERPVNRTFAAYLFGMAVWSFASFEARAGLFAGDALLWSRVLASAGSGVPILFYHFVRVFLGLKMYVWRLYLGYALYAASVLVLMFTDLGITNAYVVGPEYHLEEGPAMPLIAGWGIVFLGLAVYRLWQRYAQSRDPNYRARTRYPLIGVSLIVMGYLSNQVPALRVYPLDQAANALNALILTYSILRDGVIDMSHSLRRGVTYFLVTILAGGGYLISVFVLAYAIQRFGLLAVLLAFLVAVWLALVSPPLRSRGQLLVDRLLSRRNHAVQGMLRRLSSTAAETIELQTLTHLILNEITTTMEIDGACIFLRDMPAGEFYVAAGKDIDDGALEIRWQPDHPVLRGLSTGRGVVTRAEVDLEPEFRSLGGQERADLDRLGAEVFIPLRVKDDLVGVFVVGPKAARAPYSADDKIAMATLANQTAVAVENARLYATERRRLTESLILLDIATAVGSTLDLTQVLKLIARRTAEACGAHRTSIFLLDEQRQRLLPLMSQFASETEDEQLWRRYRYDTYMQTVDEIPILRQVFQDRQPLILDADTVGQLPDAWITPFGIRSLLIVPLVSRDRVIGAMALDHVEAGKRFEQDQINLAMTIGSQAAAAIENARLYEQTIEEKAKTEIVLQETFSGIIVVDDQWRIVSMNPGAELITGFAAEKVQGKHITDVFGAEIADPGSPLARACETRERVLPVETTLLSASEGRKDVLLGATPLSGEGKPPSRCLLSFADISKLKEVDRLKSNIVTNVSHELRSPLSSIKAYAELLLLGAERSDAELRRNWLSVIDRETDRLTTLINNLLDLSRLESGRIELTKAPLQLGEIVGDVVALFQVQAEQRGINIEVNVQPGLPPLLAEEGLIRSVVRNLVGNAIKFNRDGGQVRIAISEDDGNLKLSVEDDGIGISQDAIPHLFTKFFRAPSAAAVETHGTGLGLALAREAVVAHGGRIEVDSTLGKGSRFTVIIPQTG